MPKQFIEIGDTPIIVLTIRRMLQVGSFDKVFVAIHPSWMSYLEALVREAFGEDDRLVLIEGGEERLDSITNSVEAAIAEHGLRDEDIIVLHDAVRPFVSQEILENSITGALKHAAVVAAVPATDTMLWIEEGITVASMPDRSKLYHGQAPDSFQLKVLKESLDTLTDEERCIITGTAQICMLKGIPVHTIPGERNNIKITTPEDLVTAEGLLYEENNS